jgi:hypothetical protein
MEPQKLKPRRNALLRKQLVMGNITIKGGTPRTSDTLCRTCSNSHIIKGFSASEEEFFCRMFYIERRIRFAVFECSKYEDVRLASRKDMEEIAWFLTTRKAGRSVGFVSAERFHEMQEEPDASPVNNDTTESTE